ncbi:MAG: peptidylprolyl isomerase [Sphingobium sp.]|nr:peptidylprolyl isomerase [Sphingobium sp.]
MLATPADAQRKKSEAEIQAQIEADIKAEQAAREKAAAEAAANQPAPPPPAPVAPPPPRAPAAPPVPARVYQTVPVILTTTLGPITIAVETERAPITSANFLRYVDEKRLDGTQFYRAFTFAPDFPNVGMIQGGTQNDPKRVLKPVPHEPTSKTGLTHDDGAVSLARNGLNSGTADFFVIMGEMKGLDAGSGQNGPDDQGFAVFGHVTQGMDIVRAITRLPRSPTKGEGPMKGQMLEPPVKILTARRAPAP